MAVDAYKNALDYLDSLINFETKKGPKSTEFALDNIKHAYELLKIADSGFPPVIHIAGTKGKGSTAHFVRAILSAAGLKVGLFTSPHLLDVRERITVNNEMITAEDFSDILLNNLQPLKEQVRLSYFETLNLCALLYFKRENVDFVILETGLGGRLDSTNIMNPCICAITDIALDHTEILGNTIEEIAKEKAGIIKSHVKVVTPKTQNTTALSVISKQAKSLNAPLILSPIYDGKMAIFGDYQRINSGIAAAICAELGIKRKKIEQGIVSMTLPGRGQIVSDKFAKSAENKTTVIFDGAHNPYALSALLRSVETEYKNKRTTLFLGILEDKNWREMVEIALKNENIEKITFVTAPNPRAVLNEKLLEYAAYFSHNNGVLKEIVACDNLHSSVSSEIASKENIIIITGSFYLFSLF